MPLTSPPRDAGLGQHAADGIHRRVPPVLGPLLGPQRALHAHVFVGSGVARADGAALIHQEGARAPGADIDAQATCRHGIIASVIKSTFAHRNVRHHFRYRRSFAPSLDPEFVAGLAVEPRLSRRGPRERRRPSRWPSRWSAATARVSVFRTAILPHEGDNVAVNQRYAERLLKFLLWQKGGCRVTIAGDPRIADYLRGVYCARRRARLRLSTSWASASTAGP